MLFTKLIFMEIDKVKVTITITKISGTAIVFFSPMNNRNYTKTIDLI